MKNVYEVLRQKELELARLEKEVEALRVAAPLLSDDKDIGSETTTAKPTTDAVASAGAIGFVGLVVPQGLRLAGVQATRPLAMLSALGGATLLAAADLAARTVAPPLELPVGAVMALIGAPLFIVFLARSSR